MGSSDVLWPVPLTRLKPWYPGQYGVPGADAETGLRLHSTGAVFYVDPNHVDANDSRDGTDPDSPLATVAAALLRCQPMRGDTIAVMASNAWQYADPLDGVLLPISEEVTVNCPGVKIVGVHPSSSLGVLWTPASNGGLCIKVNALDVLIEGFVFDDGAYAGCDAIFAEWNAGLGRFGDSVVIRNCVFSSSVDMAIQLEFVWYGKIHNNLFTGCDEYGIYVDPNGSGIQWVEIYDNKFLDCDVAMALRGADDCDIKNNVVYNSRAQGGVAATDEGIDTATGSRNAVCDNYFSCILPAALAGDLTDLCTGSATDAWINNHCTNGLVVATPA